MVCYWISIFFKLWKLFVSLVGLHHLLSSVVLVCTGHWPAVIAHPVIKNSSPVFILVLIIKINSRKSSYLLSFRGGSLSSSALGTYQKVPWRGCTALINLSTVTSPNLDSLPLPAMFLRIVLNVSTLLHMCKYISPSSLEGSFSTWPYGIETRSTRGWRVSTFTGGTSCTTCTHAMWAPFSACGMNEFVWDFLPIMSSFWIYNSPKMTKMFHVCYGPKPMVHLICYCHFVLHIFNS